MIFFSSLPYIPIWFRVPTKAPICYDFKLWVISSVYMPMKKVHSGGSITHGEAVSALRPPMNGEALYTFDFSFIFHPFFFFVR